MMCQCSIGECIIFIIIRCRPTQTHSEKNTHAYAYDLTFGEYVAPKQTRPSEKERKKNRKLIYIEQYDPTEFNGFFFLLSSLPIRFIHIL